MFFVVGSSVRVLKAAAFKRFSVRPCWSPILLKFQNSIAGIFQCIFNKISGHVFYRKQWTGTLEIKKEDVNIGHQLFCLSQELLQKRPKFRFFNFCYKFPLGIIFGGYHFFKHNLKNIFDQEKATKIQFLSEKKENNLFLRNHEML